MSPAVPVPVPLVLTVEVPARVIDGAARVTLPLALLVLPAVVTLASVSAMLFPAVTCTLPPRSSAISAASSPLISALSVATILIEPSCRATPAPSAEPMFTVLRNTASA